MNSPKRFFSSFFALNLTQFFTALNDNIYKLLLVFFLISIKGPEESNTILSLAGAIFVIPFILFANLSGTLSDRFSKRSIIVFTRLVEIVVVSMGVVAIAFHSGIAGYAVLFLMATQSAIFSPSKYGILPEIVSKERLSSCNGIMTATTYLAIILGTFLASFLSEVTHKNFVLASMACVLIALCGASSSLRIEKTLPQASGKKVSARFLSEILKTLSKARRVRFLLPALIFGAYFLFMGSYAQLNMIPFAMQSLHLSDIQGGYLFLMTAIGIGLGSFFAGKLSGKEVELGFLPFAALGIGLTLIVLYHCCLSFFWVVPLLILLGALGGFFIVPIDSFIQISSPPEDRGQNVAAGNFLSFIGVIIASFAIAFLGNMLKLSAAEGFLVVGFLTLGFSLLIFFLIADQVLRLFIARLFPLFFTLKVLGKKNLSTRSSILIAPRTNWIDTLLLMASLPRVMRIIVPHGKHASKTTRWYHRYFHFIYFDSKSSQLSNTRAIQEIRREIDCGHSICLMHPASPSTKQMHHWEEILSSYLQKKDLSIIPVYIQRPVTDETLSPIKQLWSLRNYPLKVIVGDSVKTR